MADQHDRDVPWCFNRKEVKDHGEGGNTVGAPLRGRVLIVDDVITAGTAIGEVMEVIEQSGAEAAGVVVGLDRRERGPDGRSAIQAVEAAHGVPVASIVAVDEIIEYLAREPGREATVEAIREYRNHYGV